MGPLKRNSRTPKRSVNAPEEVQVIGFSKNYLRLLNSRRSRPHFSSQSPGGAELFTKISSRGLSGGIVVVDEVREAVMTDKRLPGVRNLQVRLVPVERLIPYCRNARTHSDAQVARVAASIREFGWTNPILIRPDGVMIAGHARHRQAEPAANAKKDQSPEESSIWI